ncbi:G protein-coupled receptor 157 [Microdochium nivale]|nr:G protein-coupled receptor 157 [Microdochium nivale]
MERPMYGYGHVALPENGRSLSPLSPRLRQGLLVTAILGGVSVASTTWLFFYLTWRILKWKLAAPSQRPGPPPAADSLNVDLSLGLSEQHYRQYIQSTQATRAGRASPLRRLSSATVTLAKKPVVTVAPAQAAAPTAGDQHSSSAVTLIYHLLLADVQQSAAFVISAYWLQYDGIFVPSIPCYAQGWLLGLAKLAAAGFLSIISMNTYLTLVWGYKPPRRIIYWAILFNWVFSFACTLGGVVGTQTGMAKGGYYTRTGAWCWINPGYEHLRLWLEYFWIFSAMVLTTVLHGLIVWSLWKNNHSPRYLPRQISRQSSRAILTDSSTTSRQTEEAVSEADEANRPSGHHSAFLLYPLIYIICVAPLAIARCIDMARGAGTVSGAFYLVAGALLACHGWMNVVLWTTTVIFVSSKDAKNTGLDRFAFIRTPRERRFGNIVWVQGGNNANVNANNRDEDYDSSQHVTKLLAAPTWLGRLTQRLRLRPFSQNQTSKSFRNSLATSGYLGPSSASQESLQRSARAGSHSGPATMQAAAASETSGGIQMEVVTTIVIEREDDTDYFGRDLARSLAPSYSCKASLEDLRDWRP